MFELNMDAKLHIKNLLNLNPGNFKKYATYYLDLNQPVIFVVGSEDEDQLKDLSEVADELGFTQTMVIFQ